MTRFDCQLPACQFFELSELVLEAPWGLVNQNLRILVLNNMDIMSLFLISRILPIRTYYPHVTYLFLGGSMIDIPGYSPYLPHFPIVDHFSNSNGPSVPGLQCASNSRPRLESSAALWLAGKS